MWEGGCAELGGLYQGDNTVCGDCPAFAAGEIEPNNRKLDANPVVLANGESLAGLTTAALGHGDPASPDYFLVQTPPAPLGIYRHELALTNPTTPGNVPSLRYQGQENTPGTWPCDLGTPSTIFGDDTFGTFATTEPDGAAAVTWYGFGREEQVYYRVDGTETTTDPYLATLETTAIAPTDLGAFQPGEITIQTPDTSDYIDTVLCVFDESLDPIPGYFNDNATVAGGAPADSFDASFLRRTYEPGTYYMAISIGDIVTELGVPCDSDAFAPIAYEMTDFPDAVFGFTGSFFFDQTDVSFSITDAAGTTSVPAARGTGNDLAWFTFTVGDACPADLDGSGAVDVFDLLNYLDLWFTADPGAERTGDEPAAIDVFDLLAYLDGWFAGC
jgi:hypothetical protein